MQAVVVDPEVMGDFVHDSGNDFVHHIFIGIADCADRPAVDEDAIRELANAVAFAFGQRDAVVEPKNVGVLTLIFDQENDVVDEPKEILWDQIDGLAH